MSCACSYQAVSDKLHCPIWRKKLFHIKGNWSVNKYFFFALIKRHLSLELLTSLHLFCTSSCSEHRISSPSMYPDSPPQRLPLNIHSRNFLLRTAFKSELRPYHLDQLLRESHYSWTAGRYLRLSRVLVPAITLRPWVALPGPPEPPHRQTLIDSARLKLSQKTRSSAKSTRVVEGDSKILEPPETSITNWIELSCQGWKSLSGFLSVRWSDK